MRYNGAESIEAMIETRGPGLSGMRLESVVRRCCVRDLPAGTVTLLFTDMEGSTRLLQQAWERYAGMLEECRQLFRTAFHAYGGYEVDTQGDAFLVAFARASDAVKAAVVIQRALFTHAWPEGLIVRLCMGLHTGEPQLAVDGGTPNPRKLSVDSIKIADATPNVAATNTGARVLGRTCLKIVRASEAPSALAATT